MWQDAVTRFCNKVSDIAGDTAGYDKMDKYQITVDTFDRLAERYQSKYMAYEPYVTTYNRLVELLSHDAPVILDVACGPGNIAKFLCEHIPSAKIHGYDLAPNMVALAEQNCPSGIFAVKDCRALHEIAGEFDGLISGFCFPYLSKNDVAVFMAQARRLLRTDGYLYISTMEDSDQRTGFDTNASGDQVFINYHHFDHLKDLLTKHSFKIVEFERMQYPVPDSDPNVDLFIYAQAI